MPLKCNATVQFIDRRETLILDALDHGDKYRVVLTWADSLDVPDQGLIPGLFFDLEKRHFHNIGDATIHCLNILQADVMFNEAFTDKP